VAGGGFDATDHCLNSGRLGIWRGGCTKDRIRGAMDKELCDICASFKMFLEDADAEFDFLAEKWQRGERPGAALTQ